MRKTFAIILVSILLLVFVSCEETEENIEDTVYTFFDMHNVEVATAVFSAETEDAADIPEPETLDLQTTLSVHTTKQPDVLPFVSQTVVTTAIIEEAKEIIQADYILNTNSKVFHYPSCKSVDKMKEKNKKYFVGTRDEAVSMGYKSCGNCHP